MRIKYRVYFLTTCHHLRSAVFNSLVAVDNFCRIRGNNNILHIDTEA